MNKDYFNLNFVLKFINNHIVIKKKLNLRIKKKKKSFYNYYFHKIIDSSINFCNNYHEDKNKFIENYVLPVDNMYADDDYFIIYYLYI